MEIYNKQEYKEDFEPETTIDNKLELLKFSAQVQSRIKTDISEDFILAKLNEKDKESIIEMTSNAYFTKFIFEKLKRLGTKWNYDINTKTYTKRRLNKSEINHIDLISKNTFDIYMNRIFMTTILNRNIEGNHLLRLINGLDENIDEVKPKNEDFKEKIKSILSPEEN